MLKHYVRYAFDALFFAVALLGGFNSVVGFIAVNSWQATAGSFMILNAVWYLIYRFEQIDFDMFKQQVEDERLEERVKRVAKKFDV